MSYEFKINCYPKELAIMLAVHSLYSRRTFNDTLFILILIKGTVVRPEIFEQTG